MGGRTQFWTLLLVLCMGAAVTVAQTCNPTDKSAMKYFEREIVFSGKAFLSWKEEVDCCTWQGVTCNSAGRVEALTVVATDVVTPRPVGEPYIMGTGLGDLVALKNLTMVNIAYNGALPTTLGGLTNLEVVNLDGCNISGTIPEEMCKLTKLQILIMKANLLTGSVPDCLSKLPALKTLDLTGNSFDGPAPQI